MTSNPDRRSANGRFGGSATAARRIDRGFVPPLPPQGGPAWMQTVREWQLWQRARCHSAHTIAARSRRVVLFAEGVGVDPTTASADDVVGYLARTDVTSGTLATYHAHLKAWFTWLRLTGRRLDDPMLTVPAPRTPRRKPRPLTDDQLKRLLATPMRARTRMMVLLAAFQGLRVHEIAKMRGEDADLQAMQLRVVGKGGVDVTLPLHPAVADAMTGPRKANFPATGYWFTSYGGNSSVRAGGPILARSVSNIVGKAMERAGIDGGPHRLRHTYGTQLVQNGVNIRVVQELLRHASLQTTQIYTGVSFDQQAAALRTLTLPD